jgi:hypothetical protein
MSLDDDLAAWAATVRLTDADAEAMFQRIALRGTVTTATANATGTGNGPRPAARAARQPHGLAAFPATAAASRTALSAPAGLPPSWWRDYTKGFAARMVTATRPLPVAA